MRMSNPTKVTLKDESLNPEILLCGDSAVTFKNGSVELGSNTVRSRTTTNILLEEQTELSTTVTLQLSQLLQLLTLQLSQLLEVLKLRRSDENGDKPVVEVDEWKFAALVIERTCVVFFGTFQVICSLTLVFFIFRNFAMSKY